MLSVTCKAAIKAVVYLGSKFESNTKCSISEIAEYIEENEHTVGKLLQTLVKDEVINSVKGPSGGFYITSRQMNQAIMNIVESIDGKEVFKECGLGLSKCSGTHPCPIHNDYKAIRDLFEKLCRNKKIKDLCVPVNDGFAYLIA